MSAKTNFLKATRGKFLAETHLLLVMFPLRIEKTKDKGVIFFWLFGTKGKFLTFFFRKKNSRLKLFQEVADKAPGARFKGLR